MCIWEAHESVHMQALKLLDLEAMHMQGCDAVHDHAILSSLYKWSIYIPSGWSGRLPSCVPPPGYLSMQ